MTTNVKFIATTADRLSQLEIKNGQLIFVNDTRKICLDLEGQRTEYSQFIVLNKESQRVDYLTPIEAFYFVQETKIFWQYIDGQWIQLTSPPKENIIFLNYSELPEIGQEKVLYITEYHSYIWDGEGYTQLGAQVWESF